MSIFYTIADNHGEDVPRSEHVSYIFPRTSFAEFDEVSSMRVFRRIVVVKTLLAE